MKDGKFNPPPIRIPIDESLVEKPIDVTQQLKGGCLVIFDDIDTILDDKLKKAVMKRMVEVTPRKPKLSILRSANFSNLVK